MYVIRPAFDRRYFYENTKHMKRNVGNVDVMLRILAAIVLADLATDQAINGHWNILFWALAILLGVTGIIGWCPLYALFHIHTGSNEHEHQ